MAVRKKQKWMGQKGRRENPLPAATAWHRDIHTAYKVPILCYHSAAPRRGKPPPCRSSGQVPAYQAISYTSACLWPPKDESFREIMRISRSKGSAVTPPTRGP